MIAFFESNDFDFHKPAQPKKFALMVMKIGDTEPREIFSRPGSAEWVESLRLSPRGERIAFIAMDQTSRSRREIPGTYYTYGQIEVWNAATQTGGPTGVIALRQDKGISWFPDGKRLAYVGALGDDLNSIFVLNVETGERTRLPLRGSSPVVSSDGNSILVTPRNMQRDAENYFHYELFDLQTGISTTVRLPSYGGPIAVLSEDTILYWGLPTTGTAQKLDYRKVWMFTLKLTEVKSGKFETIVPYIDHHAQMHGGFSFGSCNAFYRASAEPRATH